MALLMIWPCSASVVIVAGPSCSAGPHSIYARVSAFGPHRQLVGRRECVSGDMPAGRARSTSPTTSAGSTSALAAEVPWCSFIAKSSCEDPFGFAAQVVGIVFIDATT
jgi:hypothetical protein